jgi:peptidoglycan/xylan/chitin deacetylase (PgdA/CDA1 family)
VTFDDLPAVHMPPSESCDLEALEEMTERLLGKVTANQVPAVGLVVESRLCDELRAQHLASLLERWLNAGLELGNHSFSHFDLNRTPPEQYQQDILRGARTTARLLSDRGKELRYFRYPFLHTGGDPESKRAVESFLTEQSYTNAPVTIDNQEWIFAAVYARAKDRGDAATAKKVSDAYIPYLETMFEYYEKLSITVFEREIRQVLLLHANPLNADTFDALAEMMTGRGYSFVSLEKALADDAYRSPDTYVGSQGLSWLRRWAQAKGINVADEPREPAWLAELLRTY